MEDANDTAESPVGRRGSMHHLRLTVTDLAEAHGFYGPLLGFMGYELFQRTPARLGWVAAAPGGGRQFVIVTLAAEEHRHERANRRRAGLHHFAFCASSRADVEALHALMTIAGARTEGPPAAYDYQPGYYAAYFLDPDGTKIEFVHVP
jgi:catechol 2,3-dioxygenase-like lactoylglutathione lyase family enzyme